MDQKPAVSPGADGLAASTNGSRPPGPARKRSLSGTAGGLLSRIPFVRSSRSGDNLRPKSRRSSEETDPSSSASFPFPPVPEFPSATDALATPRSSVEPLPLSPTLLQQQQQQQQQQKTRRRKGSLRKVALLGRGAQRERKESKGSLAVDTKVNMDLRAAPASAPPSSRTTPFDARETEAYGLGISDVTPRPSMDGFASRSATSLSAEATPTATTAPNGFSGSASAHGQAQVDGTDSSVTSPTISYSTTDDEDALHIGGSPSRPTTPSSSLLRPERASLSSGSEGYSPSGVQHASQRSLGITGSRGTGSSLPSIQRRRSATQRAKSPLSLSSLTGLSTTPLPPSDTDWDYAETEWWGWVVLIVTWVVFVTGMGSTLGVWSWAWDVGTTPYAPPELEDDPTLPIVGYYPALIILTCVMAWVWVVVAWVGMKYFRHARVSGD
ncbi:hypothetical protein GQ53DRAFT_746928 [Thozetella sp. PMI_491]|nr:hypothetical protein GQ53DRAFT_746928 [Thozetella sp. PMI_491]